MSLQNWTKATYVGLSMLRTNAIRATVTKRSMSSDESLTDEEFKRKGGKKVLGIFDTFTLNGRAAYATTTWMVLIGIYLWAKRDKPSKKEEK